MSTSGGELEPIPQTQGPVWPHASSVASWVEVFRGQTLGHGFPGSATATVSVRVSDANLINVGTGSPAWRALPLGATVSQLVLLPGEATRWSVAYVAERNDRNAPTSDVRDVLSAVSYFVVTPDGQIDARSAHLCASCHLQRYSGQR